MNARRALSLLVLASFAAAFDTAGAEPEKLILWPDGAPGAKGKEATDQPWMDLYVPPKEKANGAAMVVLPGGGYGGLAADHEGAQPARFFNALGCVSFVLHYRLGSNGYHHPIELNDAKRAVRWVRANAARYGIEPSRIGIIGHSAGGHLASCAATMFDAGDPKAADPVDRVSSRPDVAVLCYPVISMSDDFMHRGSRKNLLGPEDGNEELAKQMSTQNRVTPETPPTFIFQTHEDTVVPSENAVSFYLALHRNGVPAELHLYEHGPHGVGLMLSDPVLGTWPGHLRDWLRNRGFFRPAKRTAISGMLTVNGTPVSWGGVVFQPEDEAAPVASARVMHGKFSLPEASGPVIGRTRLRVSYSAADVPGLETPDGTVTTTRQSSAATEDWVIEIHPGEPTLKLDVQR